MRIHYSIYYTAILALFVAGPVLAAESISQIQSLEGRVWIQRGDESIEANASSEVYSGDLLSTSDTGRLGTRLWSQMNLKLGASSKVIIVSDENKNRKGSSNAQKMIKLEYGSSCIEIDQFMDSPVLFQVGYRVTINIIKPVELCLSSDDDESQIQLVKGRVELMHLTNSMLIALNEPGSEISFFNGGIFKLLSTPSATPRFIPKEDLKAFAKMKDLKEPPKAVGLKVPAESAAPLARSEAEGPNESAKPEDLNQPSNTVDLNISSNAAVPIALSKTEGTKESLKTEDLKETPEKVDPKVSSKPEVPIALAKIDDSKQLPITEQQTISSKSEAQQVLSKPKLPIALDNAEGSDKFSKIKDTNAVYNVYLHKSRSYEATAAVNRRLTDAGYSSVVIDEIDNQGPVFRISVPNFETITAARGFVDKVVVVSLGIHDAWIEKSLTQRAKTQERKASSKTEDKKLTIKPEVPVALAKTVAPKKLDKTALKESSKTSDQKAASAPDVPVALAKSETPDNSSKIKDTTAVYNVYLHTSRSYEATAAVNRRLTDAGYSSVVIDEIDNQGPLFRISVPNFATITDARGFVDKVVVASLDIHDAWIEKRLTQRPKTEERKASSKTDVQKVLPKPQVPVVLAKIEGEKDPVKTEASTDSPNSIDLGETSKTQEAVARVKAEDADESAKPKDTNAVYNVYLNSGRSYEVTAAVNRRLRDAGYRSVVIDEIDNIGPLFRISVPNFETITAARGFVDKVVVRLGVHDAWIERQQKNN